MSIVAFQRGGVTRRSSVSYGLATPAPVGGWREAPAVGRVVIGAITYRPAFVSQPTWHPNPAMLDGAHTIKDTLGPVENSLVSPEGGTVAAPASAVGGVVRLAQNALTFFRTVGHPSITPASSLAVGTPIPDMPGAGALIGGESTDNVAPLAGTIGPGGQPISASVDPALSADVADAQAVQPNEAIDTLDAGGGVTPLATVSTVFSAIGGIEAVWGIGEAIQHLFFAGDKPDPRIVAAEAKVRAQYGNVPGAFTRGYGPEYVALCQADALGPTDAAGRPCSRWASPPPTAAPIDPGSREN